jgi:hypothetical protein
MKIKRKIGNGAAQPISLIIAFVSSTGAIYQAVVIGIIVFTVWRGAKNKREKRDNHALVHPSGKKQLF